MSKLNSNHATYSVATATLFTHCTVSVEPGIPNDTIKFTSIQRHFNFVTFTSTKTSWDKKPDQSPFYSMHYVNFLIVSACNMVMSKSISRSCCHFEAVINRPHVPLLRISSLIVCWGKQLRMRLTMSLIELFCMHWNLQIKDTLWSGFLSQDVQFLEVANVYKKTSVWDHKQCLWMEVNFIVSSIRNVQAPLKYSTVCE